MKNLHIIKTDNPNSFCETPEENCTMNYCDDNGCQNRVRNLVGLKEKGTEFID